MATVVSGQVSSHMRHEQMLQSGSGMIRASRAAAGPAMARRPSWLQSELPSVEPAGAPAARSYITRLLL